MVKQGRRRQRTSVPKEEEKVEESIVIKLLEEESFQLGDILAGLCEQSLYQDVVIVCKDAEITRSTRLVLAVVFPDFAKVLQEQKEEDCVLLLPDYNVCEVKEKIVRFLTGRSLDDNEVEEDIEERDDNIDNEVEEDIKDRDDDIDNEVEEDIEERDDNIEFNEEYPKKTSKLKTSSKGGVFSCDVCSKQFTLKIGLLGHIKTHQKESLICDMCGKHFTRRANMKLHIEKLCKNLCNTQRKSAKIQAEVEGYLDGTEQSWVRYNVTPSGDFTCADCDFQTETVAQIVKHRYSEHGEEDRLKNKKRIRQNKNRNRQRKGEGFSCPKDNCNKNFISTKNLALHVKQCGVEVKKEECKVCKKLIHPNSMFQHLYYFHKLEPDPAMFQCDKCDFKVDYTQDGVSMETCRLKMRNHKSRCLNVNQPEQPCQLCDFVGKTKLSLTGHMYYVHNDNRFQCDMCDFKAGISSRLIDHKASEHGIYRFSCEHCGKKVMRKTSLKKHLWSAHGIGKSWEAKCDLCGMILSSEANLKKHRGKINCRNGTKIGQRQKPWSKELMLTLGSQRDCKICKIRLESRSAYIEHRKTHRDRGIWICRLDDCTFTCKELRSMKSHADIHHQKSGPELPLGEISVEVVENNDIHGKEMEDPIIELKRLQEEVARLRILKEIKDRRKQGLES